MKRYYYLSRFWFLLNAVLFPVSLLNPTLLKPKSYVYVMLYKLPFIMFQDTHFGNFTFLNLFLSLPQTVSPIIIRTISIMFGCGGWGWGWGWWGLYDLKVGHSSCTRGVYLGTWGGLAELIMTNWAAETRAPSETRHTRREYVSSHSIQIYVHPSCHLPAKVNTKCVAWVCILCVPSSMTQAYLTYGRMAPLMDGGRMTNFTG